MTWRLYLRQWAAALFPFLDPEFHFSSQKTPLSLFLYPFPTQLGNEDDGKEAVQVALFSMGLTRASNRPMSNGVSPPPSVISLPEGAQIQIETQKQSEQHKSGVDDLIEEVD